MPNPETNSAWTETRAIFRRLGPAGPIALLSTFGPIIGSVFLYYFLSDLGAALRSMESGGWLLFTVVFVLTSGLALLPTHAQAILGGWAFGLAGGLGGSLVGFTGGALIGFYMARRSAGDRAVQLLDERPKWKAVYHALLDGGFWRTLGLVTLLRLPPSSPFALSNFVMSATKVPLAPYIIGTIIGMTPRLAVAVYLGTTLENLHKFEKPWWLWVATIVTALVALGVIGHIGNRALTRVTNNLDKQPPQQEK